MPGYTNAKSNDLKCKMVADRLARIGDEINKGMSAKKLYGGFSSSLKSSSTSSGGYGKSLGGGMNKSLSSYGKSTSILNSRKGTSL